MFTFTDDCLIGITEIDEEHRGLFDLINEISKLLSQSAADAEIADNVLAKNLLVKLKDYAKNHFAHEESYMEKRHDPELSKQKREHAQFVDKIESYETVSITDEEGRKIVQELLNYLVRWLYGHILSSDMMIGKLPSLEGQDDIFAFTDVYKTGIDFVDEEHKRLFELIRETNDAIHDELRFDKYDDIMHIISGLRDYTEMHFHDEEEYMEKISYSELDAQRRAHQAFVDKLNEVDLNEVDDNQQEYLEELIAFLVGWLSNHILKMDKRIPLA
jgi:hemerythrin